MTKHGRRKSASSPVAAATKCALSLALVVTGFDLAQASEGVVRREPGGQALTLEQLVEKRSIDSIVVAPDGARVAFRVLAPSVSENRIEANWFETPIDGRGPVRRLGKAATPRFRPFFDSPLEEQPLWSPDGEGIFVQQLDENGVQIHLLGPNGSDRHVTRDPADIERFALAADGGGLDYWTRADRAAIDAADAEENRSGIHFDRTILTDGLPLRHNYLEGARWVSLRQQDDKSYRPNHAGDLRLKHVSIPHAAKGVSLGGDVLPVLNPLLEETVNRRLAFGNLEVGLVPLPRTPDMILARYQLVAYERGRTIRCDDALCLGNTTQLRLIVPGRHGEVYFLRVDFGAARAKVYAWNLHRGGVRLVYDAKGSLGGGGEGFARSCAAATDRLICVHSTPTTPPRLVSVDLRTGAVKTLFEPNTVLQHAVLPETRYIEWKDRHGRLSTGVLVTPAVRDRPLPLVITTYRCKGFLDGGVASLAPEFLLAQRGFAVLCSNSNDANNDLPPEDPADPVLKMHKADIEGYRAVIAMLADQGVIDRNRVGISGHSYSGNIISYAISHTDLFKAAIIGSGISIDSESWWVTAPTSDSWRRADLLNLVHLPPANKDPDGIWKKVAPSLNADAIHAALLFQPPECEYLLATQLYAAIQQSGGAVDMYVYPGAGHMVERFPTQQMARAQRSIDWFSFWLGNDDARARIGALYPAWQRLLSAPNGPRAGR